MEMKNWRKNLKKKFEKKNSSNRRSQSLGRFPKHLRTPVQPDMKTEELLLQMLQFGNSYLFLFFPVTVAENSWKNQMSGNFVFSSWKMGVESRGTRRDPVRGRDGVYPCLRPPFFNEKTQNYANFGFFNCFLQRDW